MKTLLHICCAPCSVACIENLLANDIDLTGYWYNPNIHPFMEYKSRRDTLLDYAKQIDLPLIVNDDYGLREFVKSVADNIENRCRFCYETRLNKTAELAAQNGFDSFSTTLLISPYQNHELIKQVAEKASEKHQIEFLYKDFRPKFREGQQIARDSQFYMQKYCGCIFSEEDRYCK